MHEHHNPLREFVGTTRFGVTRAIFHRMQFAKQVLIYLDCPNLACLRDFNPTVFGITPSNIGSDAESMNALVLPLRGADVPAGEYLVFINQMRPKWHVWNIHLITLPDPQTSETIATVINDYLLPYVMGQTEFTMGSWLLVTEQKFDIPEWKVQLAECSITEIYNPHKLRFFRLAAAIAAKQQP